MPPASRLRRSLQARSIGRRLRHEGDADLGEGRGLAAEALPAHRQTKAQAFVALEGEEGVDDAHEAVGPLVVLPAVVPYHTVGDFFLLDVALCDGLERNGDDG